MPFPSIGLKQNFRTQAMERAVASIDSRAPRSDSEFLSALLRVLKHNLGAVRHGAGSQERFVSVSRFVVSGMKLALDVFLGLILLVKRTIMTQY